MANVGSVTATAATKRNAIELAVYKCPSCGTKLAAFEVSDSATVVVSRTCRTCGDRWQVISAPARKQRGCRVDVGTLTFLDNRSTRRRLNAQSGGAQ